MKVFVGAAASNTHLYQIGQALEEADALAKYILPFGGFPLKHPMLFSSRCPVGIPKSKLDQHPAWEIARVAASKLKAPAPWIDLIWERGEHAFDLACAKTVESHRPDAFIGVEHAALAALKKSKEIRTAAGLIYTSLHHKFRNKWMEPELDRFPELLNRSARIIRDRDNARDARRDEEMGVAEFLHANSSTTARSLVDAGFPADRIITVPLGSPPALSEGEIRPHQPPNSVVLFVGNIALHKGAHHLLEAWGKIPGKGRARLEMYGNWALPKSLMPREDANVTLHGKVSRAAVRDAMRQASVLVLPSVCDGFGMVVSEAMAQGLPVICSSNAGASQLVVEGRNGFVLPPAEPERLATLLEWCLAHPAELNSMGRSAAETARSWTWADFRSGFTRGLFEMLARPVNRSF